LADPAIGVVWAGARTKITDEAVRIPDAHAIVHTLEDGFPIAGDQIGELVLHVLLAFLRPEGALVADQPLKPVDKAIHESSVSENDGQVDAELPLLADADPRLEICISHFQVETALQALLTHLGRQGIGLGDVDAEEDLPMTQRECPLWHELEKEELDRGLIPNRQGAVDFLGTRERGSQKNR
jgi:hypothetical protein